LKELSGRRWPKRPDENCVEPIELTDKVLSQGSPTPIEVKVMPQQKLNEDYAHKVIDKLKQISYLRHTD